MLPLGVTFEGPVGAAPLDLAHAFEACGTAGPLRDCGGTAGTRG